VAHSIVAVVVVAIAEVGIEIADEEEVTMVAVAIAVAIAVHRNVAIPGDLQSMNKYSLKSLSCFRYGPPQQTRHRVIVENLSSRCSWQVSSVCSS
jgi:hypothetical protein